MTVCAVYQGGVVVTRVLVSQLQPCDRLERLSSYAHLRHRTGDAFIAALRTQTLVWVARECRSYWTAGRLSSLRLWAVVGALEPNSALMHHAPSGWSNSTSISFSKNAALA
jgi:hypothetical protein